MKFDNSAMVLAENQAAGRVAQTLGASVIRLPARGGYGASHILNRSGRTLAVLEMRPKQFNHDKYGRMWVPLGRIMAGMALAQTVGAPYILSYAFTDKILFGLPDNIQASSVLIPSQTDVKFQKYGLYEVEPQVVFQLNSFRPLEQIGEALNA